ncbi:STAS domain-containing protein [Agaribacterium haliotis]|uniref:STAS domain-containing protein n=1 Tax=Agaribacterium haliotis TaxID=2013869 RepID=UPI0013044459|nr:STAS domain-containing protein [Agaribacterium haliotis]
MNVETHIAQQHNSKHLVQIALAGEFDALACSEIRVTFEQCVVEHPGSTVHINMHDVSFIDSSGIGALVFLFKRMSETGGSISLNNVAGQPEELLRLLRVDQAFDVQYV